MKYIKSILFAIPVAALIASCDKHEIEYADSTPVGDQAQFQITYVEPITVNSNNAIDSLYVNGALVASVKGAGQLTVNGTYPYGPSSGTGTFFATNTGTNNIKLFRKGNVVYDKDITLNKGKQQVFIYKLTEDPIIFDNLYPYTVNPDKPTLSTFDTDTVATIRFFNFAFKGNSNTPYPGKIQYQWSFGNGTKNANGEWNNIGEPVGFGEATERIPVLLEKEVFNSSGYDYLWFRGVDETGNVVIADDYWTTYIGSVMNHIYRGIIGGTPKAGITLQGSLR